MTCEFSDRVTDRVSFVVHLLFVNRHRPRGSDPAPLPAGPGVKGGTVTLLKGAPTGRGGTGLGDMGLKTGRSSVSACVAERGTAVSPALKAGGFKLSGPPSAFGSRLGRRRGTTQRRLSTPRPPGLQSPGGGRRRRVGGLGFWARQGESPAPPPGTRNARASPTTRPRAAARPDPSQAPPRPAPARGGPRNTPHDGGFSNGAEVFRQRKKQLEFMKRKPSMNLRKMSNRSELDNRTFISHKNH